VTFNFTATLPAIPGQLSGGPLAEGQTVSGSFTFSSPAADLDPSAERGEYFNLISFDISIPAAGYVASATPAATPGLIEILDNQDGLRDRYVASMTEPDQIVTGPAINGWALERLAIVLRDRTLLAFSSDALPLVPPPLSAFANGSEFILGFDRPGSSGNIEILAQMTSFTSSEISVPDQIDALVDAIVALQADETLNRGQANSLTQTLTRALSFIEQGNIGAATNVLTAFTHQVTALVRSRRLTATEGDALIAAAQDAIADLLDEVDAPTP
jgi:hypothetical protein